MIYQNFVKTLNYKSTIKLKIKTWSWGSDYCLWISKKKSVLREKHAIRLLSILCRTTDFEFKNCQILLYTLLCKVPLKSFVSFVSQIAKELNGLCQRWWNTGPLFGLFISALPLYFTISDIVHGKLYQTIMNHSILPIENALYRVIGLALRHSRLTIFHD